jgi:hypothetical protein
MFCLAAKIVVMRELEEMQFIGWIDKQVWMIIQQVLHHGGSGFPQPGYENRLL